MREFLRDDDGSEPLLRELLRLNLEQFAKTLAEQFKLQDPVYWEMVAEARCSKCYHTLKDHEDLGWSCDCICPRPN